MIIYLPESGHWRLEMLFNDEYCVVGIYETHMSAAAAFYQMKELLDNKGIDKC